MANPRHIPTTEEWNEEVEKHWVDAIKVLGLADKTPLADVIADGLCYLGEKVGKIEIRKGKYMVRLQPGHPQTVKEGWVIKATCSKEGSKAVITTKSEHGLLGALSKMLVMFPNAE